MASAFKKGCPIENKMGRPAKGCLSSFPDDLSADVKQIRKSHPGWGAHSILLELEENHGYRAEGLPGPASIGRYLKAQGLVEVRGKTRPLPVGDEKRCNKIKRSHDQWEMDAKGPVAIVGMGTCAPINIKDSKSKVHCISFPVPVRHKRSQPATVYYYWALRMAFERWGLPRSIRVDHDSAFHENRSSSPFPKFIHLWLIGLGVELCFIKRSPPMENAVVERSHQTINNQVYKGQQYACWKALFNYGDERVEKLNCKLPNRMLNGMAPLERYPKAVHSGRSYCLILEDISIDFKRIQRYLAKGEWFRNVSKDKTVSLGKKVYYLKNAQPRTQLRITFCNRRKKLMFHNANELLIATLPIKDLNLQSIMGGAAKDLIAMRYKLSHRRNCPLNT